MNSQNIPKERQEGSLSNLYADSEGWSNVDVDHCKPKERL